MNPKAWNLHHELNIQIVSIGSVLRIRAAIFVNYGLLMGRSGIQRSPAMQGQVWQEVSTWAFRQLCKAKEGKQVTLKVLSLFWLITIQASFGGTQTELPKATAGQTPWEGDRSYKSEKWQEAMQICCGNARTGRLKQTWLRKYNKAYFWIKTLLSLSRCAVLGILCRHPDSPNEGF